jgi:hypothetical protein
MEVPTEWEAEGVFRATLFTPALLLFLPQKLSLNNYKYQHLKFLFLRGVAGKNFITSNLN